MHPRILLLLTSLLSGLAAASPPATSVSQPNLLASTSARASGLPAGLIFENRTNPYLIWVDLEAGQLHVLERSAKGAYFNRTTRTISIGKNGRGKRKEGDQKTPVGVYQVTSHLPDKDLDDIYGIGAYPVNFPNVWDRIMKRTGHGIWLHGLPKGVASRPTFDSDGCVIVDNDSLAALRDYVQIGESLVVLSTELAWLPTGSGQASNDILDEIEKWRADWEANDTPAYLAHYHPNFTDTKRNLAAWSAYKRGVNANKRFIQVDLSEMSVIEYPGEENLVAVRFYQRYESNNHKWEGWKHLLWRRDDRGAWRILYEGNG